MKVETALVGSIGTAVIPVRLRRKSSIQKGTGVNREFIHSLRGSLKGKPSSLDRLLEERHRERAPFPDVKPTAYARREYGVTPKQMARFVEAVDKHYRQLKRRGKLRTYTPRQLKALFDLSTSR